MAILFPPLLLNFILLFRAFDQFLPISSSSFFDPSQMQQALVQYQYLNTNCTTHHNRSGRCGSFDHIPFPFHLDGDDDDDCSLQHHFHFDDDDAFRLSCLLNDTTLFLNIGSLKYQVFEFFPDGVIVDFPTTARERAAASSPSCRHYFDDFNSFELKGNAYYAISIQNVLALCDCEYSSYLCNRDIEDYCDKNKLPLPTCQRDSSNSSTVAAAASCCRPLSDYSVWEAGDGFSAFSEFGCRGFSSWVLPPEPESSSNKSGKCGVKLEWAIPSHSSQAICAVNAFIVNATTIRSGTRCACKSGFIGDGFAKGLGCLKSCTKDGAEAYGRDCYVKRNSRKKVVMLAGILALAFILAALAVLFALVRRRPVKSTWGASCSGGLEQSGSSSSVSYCKARKTQLFTYGDLEEATKGFDEEQKLSDGIGGTLHSGVLGNGLHVAVQKVQCENEENLMMVLSRVEVLSQLSHRNVARLVGCCMDMGYVLFVVYELYANGTLEEHMRRHHHQGHHQKKDGLLDWYQRLNIAVETASALAYLQYEVSPPVSHHNLSLACIFLDQDYCVKVAGFGMLLNSRRFEGGGINNKCSSNSELGGSRRFHGRRSDVYDLGLVLLGLISGSKHHHVDLPAMELPKLRSGKLEEIVDPHLYFHDLPSFQQEQIEIVADLATRCLLFGAVGRLGIKDAARELVEILKGSSQLLLVVDGGSRRRGHPAAALDETFSNSSLLQMISMSPDSIYLP